MSLLQLIYISQPFGFDDGMLNGILSDSRRNNVRDDVTGALICRADLYLQLIEGPPSAIEATFERIARDDRHGEVRRLVCGAVSERLFPAWAMRDDPARSWLWTPPEVAAGAVNRAGKPALLDVFARLAATPQ